MAVIEGDGTPTFGEALQNAWAWRDVVWAFAERNIRVKYKQSVLGVLWALIQPLSFLAIFTFVFGHTGALWHSGSSYAAFALSTLVPWLFLQTCVSSGGQALLADGNLLKKVYFPREAPVLAAILSSSVDFAIGLALILSVGLSFGIRLSWAIFLIIPMWFLLAALASGVALALSALTVYYRDFRHVVPLLLQLWMFASPVAYPLGTVPAQWKFLYVALNPVVGILDGFHAALAEGRLPDATLLAISFGATALVVCAGYTVFSRLEAGFADAI